MLAFHLPVKEDVYSYECLHLQTPSKPVNTCSKHDHAGTLYVVGTLSWKINVSSSRFVVKFAGTGTD